MRIVSLLPSATEIVCALGLEDQLVGVTHECDFPSFVRGLPKVTFMTGARVKADAAKPRVIAERKNPTKVARQLWRGLSRFNQEAAGPFRYSRVVLTARGKSGAIVGGVILQSYWLETYVELLWLSGRARRQGMGRELIQEAERRARRRGSRLMHLSTYSFQAPAFYENLGFRRCGRISGSPEGATRYFYMKRL